jgi:hypothetical protein
MNDYIILLNTGVCDQYNNRLLHVEKEKKEKKVRKVKSNCRLQRDQQQARSESCESSERRLASSGPSYMSSVVFGDCRDGAAHGGVKHLFGRLRLTKQKWLGGILTHVPVNQMLSQCVLSGL